MSGMFWWARDVSAGRQESRCPGCLGVRTPESQGSTGTKYSLNFFYKIMLDSAYPVGYTSGHRRGERVM